MHNHELEFAWRCCVWDKIVHGRQAGSKVVCFSIKGLNVMIQFSPYTLTIPSAPPPAQRLRRP